MGGTGDDWGQGVALGPDGSVYIGGEFQGTAVFNPGSTPFTLTSAGSEAAFVARLDSAGNFLWAGATGSSTSDPYGRIDNLSQGIAVAYDGSVYTTGQFEGTANLDPTGGTFNLTGTLGTGTRNNGFLAKFSAPVAGLVAPAVTLTAPAWTNNAEPSITMTATETAPGIPDGTTAYLDVDLNNDGNFTDPGDAGYLSATVTGGTATFTFTSPLPDGTYHLRARVSDQAGNQGLSAVSTMVVAAAPASVALTPPVATEEAPLNNVLVAHFGFFGSGNYSATITWGDGSTSTVTTAASAAGYIVQHDPSDLGQGFDVFASHTYADELSGATFSVQVSDGTTTISASTNTFSVADQQLTNVVLVSGNVPVSPQIGAWPWRPSQGWPRSPTRRAWATRRRPTSRPPSIGATATRRRGRWCRWAGGNYQVNAPAYTYVRSGTLNHQRDGEARRAAAADHAQPVDYGRELSADRARHYAFAAGRHVDRRDDDAGDQLQQDGGRRRHGDQLSASKRGPRRLVGHRPTT